MNHVSLQLPEFAVAPKAVPVPARASGGGRPRTLVATAGRSPRQGLEGRPGLTGVKYGTYTAFYPDRARLGLEGRWGCASLSDCTGLGLR